MPLTSRLTPIYPHLSTVLPQLFVLCLIVVLERSPGNCCPSPVLEAGEVTITGGGQEWTPSSRSGALATFLSSSGFQPQRAAHA